MLQVASIILIAWIVVRGIGIASIMMDIYDITPGGIILIQGFCCPGCDPPVVIGYDLVSWISILPFLFGIVADMIAGIAGAANWKKPERANRCLLWGIIAIAVNVMVVFTLGIAMWAVSLAIHILYIIGAYQIKVISRTAHDTGQS